MKVQINKLICKCTLSSMNKHQEPYVSHFEDKHFSMIRVSSLYAMIRVSSLIKKFVLRFPRAPVVSSPYVLNIWVK